VSSEIPGSWTSCEIGEAAKIVGGGTPPSKDETNFSSQGGIPWITPADLSGYKKIFIDRGARNLTEKGFSSCSAVKLPAGSVLFSSRAPVGYVAIASNEVSTNQGFKSFVLPDGVDSRFVYFYLRHIKPTAEAMATGTTFKELSGSVAARLPLVIAPQNEQKRIADKLVTLITKVDACRERLDRVPLILQRFRQAILSAATSGQLTEEWREERNISDPVDKALGDILKVSSGKFLPAKDMAKDGTIPVFGGNGINGYHNEGNVSEETLVIGRVGFYCGCVHMTPKLAWVTDNALLVKHNENETLKRFLFFALQATDLRTNDSSTAQPVISGQKIYSLKLVVPDIREQQEIVRRVETLFAYADRLEVRYTAGRAQVERLTPALLDKAFRGDLVPQDPNDEPAEELLERINRSKLVTADKPIRRRQQRMQEAEVKVLDPSQIQSDHLSNILKMQGRQTSKSLWQASQLAIEDFYEQLRAEEAQELLREIKQGAESFLEAA